MKKSLLLMTAVLTLCAAGAPVGWAAMVNEAAPDFTLTDTNGGTHSLSDFKGKYVVLEWVNYDCPFVKKHYNSGNMQSLQEELTAQDVVWLSVNSSAEGKQGYFPLDELKMRMEKEGAKPTAYLLDTDGRVGKMYEAKTTPHMYIINPQGDLIYQGAIDDTPSADPGDIATSENYVKSCFEAVMSGGEVAKASTKSYGCSVKY